MPKKKHNGFFHFMIEYKRREEAKGRRFRGFEDVSRVAGPIWKNMNESERAPYVAKGKQSIQKNEERLNCRGIPQSVLLAEERAARSKTALIRNRVEKMISNAAENNMLERLEFYFISFSYFCALSDGRYVPAEVGAIRYCMEEGVMEKFHMLINPGPLPLGKSLEAQEHSNNFHQLPIPPNALGEANFEEIANKLAMFLKLSGKKLPLLFTDHSDIPQVESILEEILNSNKTGMEIVVCPLAQMFFLLKKCVLYYSLSLPEGFATESIPQTLIDRDLYAYTENISCEFHEQKGDGTHCALSRCIRWAYVISDSCCLDLHIDLQPGNHMPLNCVSMADVFSKQNNTTSVSTTNNGNFRFVSAASEVNSSAIRNYDSSYAGVPSGQRADRESTEDTITDESSETHQMLTAGRGYLHPTGMIAQVRGIGRGRRIQQYDNTPPLTSSRR
ncbi:protein maelstrom homolog [Anopheles ziemanni]|uniref:protein maelstrom homolog n=1 Tax=Anopheles coustani TaxID=139045 RepID=UPI0026589A3E|nr:protein maelstrom homolog [Anopheles coustani]XP_058177304.1 protein maelstrom homolog [Anopheles ziemanni]